MTCGVISCLDRILYTWYIYTSNMSTNIGHQVDDLWCYQLSRQDTLLMIYIHQYHAFLHLTSSVCAVVWWGDHTGYSSHDIYTPVPCVLTSVINCMTCGFISCLDRILYTWYLYTSTMCAYIWHQMYDLCLMRWPYRLLCTWYIYTSNMCDYIWHQGYDLWFYRLSRQDTLHMIYIHS